jgi:hypothetical protein
MKQLMRLWMTLCLGFLLTGCAQLSPFVLSGKEREEYLNAIKPYLQYWEKPGMTPEGRREDSKECGGPRSDYTGFGPITIKTSQRPGETEGETDTHLMQDWVRCMTQKGYRHEQYVTPPKLNFGRKRLDLDLLCGRSNERCKVQRDANDIPILDANGKTQLLLNAEGLVQFDAKDEKGNPIPLARVASR